MILWRSSITQITTAVRTRVPSTALRFTGTSASTHLIRHPYYVPRNSRGSLPVYSDVRNAGSRYLILIRNVQGNAETLAKELGETLFEKTSDEAARLKIRIMRSKHLILTGGHWKNHVVEWLRAKGF